MKLILAGTMKQLEMLSETEKAFTTLLSNIRTYSQENLIKQFILEDGS